MITGCLLLFSQRLYFLDTLKNDERTLFYTEAIPVFLKSHLKITPKESWKYEWVFKHIIQTVADCGVFVCAFMYIIAEMEHRNSKWNRTLKHIMETNQSLLLFNGNEVRSTIAVSLLEKDLSYMALIFESRWNILNHSKYAWWHKLTHIGHCHIHQLLKLDYTKLQKPIPTTITTAQELSRLSIYGKHEKKNQKY